MQLPFGRRGSTWSAGAKSAHRFFGLLTQRYFPNPYHNRIHAAEALGCPIVGDDLYWPAAAAARASRGQSALPPLRKGGGRFLQSCAVSFEHLDGSTLTVSVREAPKFEALRQRGRSGAAPLARRAARTRASLDPCRSVLLFFFNAYST